MGDESRLQEEYTKLLKEYLRTGSETSLFNISKLSKEFINKGIGPEEVTEMHSSAVAGIVEGLPHEEAIAAFQQAVNPLLEIMTNYAMAYRSYAQMKERKLAEYEKGEQFKGLEKLASVGILSLGMMNELGNSLNRTAAYIKKATEKGGNSGEFPRVVLQQISRAMGVVRTVFLYSRGIARDEIKPVSINELLQESIELIKRTVSLNSISIETRFRESVRINMNVAEMRQAFVNLIAGAIEAMQGSGKLLISTAFELIGRQKYLTVRMSYDGGKPRNKCLFSLPTTGGDAGINLAQSLIRRNGGTVEFNAEGTSSSIFIKLRVPDELDNFLKAVKKKEEKESG